MRKLLVSPLLILRGLLHMISQCPLTSRPLHCKCDSEAVVTSWIMMFVVLMFCCSSLSYFLFTIFVFSSYIYFLFFVNQGTSFCLAKA